jgi:hypothetical protein
MERMRQMLDVKGAAAYLCLAPQTLAQMRVSGAGPAFYKAGRRILYDVVELDGWLSARRRTSTSQHNASGGTLLQARPLP